MISLPKSGVTDLIPLRTLQNRNSSLNFYVSTNNYCFSIQLHFQFTTIDLISKIQVELRKQFRISFIPVFRLYYFPDQIETWLSLEAVLRLAPQEPIQIRFRCPIYLPPPVYTGQKSYVFVKDLLTSAIFKLKYQDIRNLPIHAILDNYLNFKNRGLVASHHGLKICFLVVKPTETLASFQDLEEVFNEKKEILTMIHASVVKQYDLFYTHLQQIGKHTEQGFTQLNNILSESVQNQDHIMECNTKLNQIAELGTNLFQHIVYYTSELQVVQDKRSIKLYQALNNFLREQSFGLVDRSQYRKWQYQLAYGLLNNIRLIKEHKGDLYRGVSHQEAYHIGKILTFKQFTSCSTNLQAALKFADTALYVIKDCKVGRSIKNHSLYQDEEEVLNLPYVEYQIICLQKWLINGRQIDIVTMKQITSPSLNFDFINRKQLVVLWVDKSNQEFGAFSQRINQIDRTTHFYYFKSTKELKNELESSFQVDNIEGLSVVLVTNMYRVEDGVANDAAGVQALNVFRSIMPFGRVFVYVSSIDAARTKLNSNQIYEGVDLSIGNSLDDLLDVFASYGVK